ncbi:MAG: two-component system response regulator [Glaciihabitans sp.]|nr:two-component system response regulator [Glaciihabitans sp.]
MDSGGQPRVAVVVEDDDDIRHLLETVLSQAGFQVISAGNGPDGIEAVRRYEPIVTTLDVNMPGIDGFETARRIRAFSSTYIIMMTALSEEIDAMQGLDAGADDYIVKPFRPRELRARIEAMLRRPRIIADAVVAPGVAQASAPAEVPEPVASSSAPAPYVPAGRRTYQPRSAVSPAAPAPVAHTAEPSIVAPPEAVSTQEPEAASAPAPREGSGWLEHNGLWLNVETRVVQVDGRELELTRSEFDLLGGLMESGRRVRTKADLVLLLRGESYVTSHFISEADKRAIEVHLANLRKKLTDTAQTPRWVETVRGVGYRMTAGS